MITVSIEIPIPLLEVIQTFLKNKECNKCSIKTECSTKFSYCPYVLSQLNSYLDEGEINNAS